MASSPLSVAQKQRIILSWYRKHGRHDLPWRHTRDPYAIVVAEFMLQQTNVPKVVPRYQAFLQQFPNWEALATARPATVLRAWQGLGYNRRALLLHRLAQKIVQEYKGSLPRDQKILESLPGLGPYTSRAVLAFAFNANHAARDVNIDRVLRRWQGKKQISIQKSTELAAQFLPAGKSHDWHSALMDFASAVCTKRAPLCQGCPAAQWCKAYPNPQDQPTKKRQEPGYSENGKFVPRRIFRGRIIEALRHHHQGLTAQQLGLQIKSDYTPADLAWIEPLLRVLQREQFVSQTRQRWHLAK